MGSISINYSVALTICQIFIFLWKVLLINIYFLTDYPRNIYPQNIPDHHKTNQYLMVEIIVKYITNGSQTGIPHQMFTWHFISVVEIAAFHISSCFNNK